MIDLFAVRGFHSFLTPICCRACRLYTYKLQGLLCRLLTVLRGCRACKLYTGCARALQSACCPRMERWQTLSQSLPSLSQPESHIENRRSALQQERCNKRALRCHSFYGVVLGKTAMAYGVRDCVAQTVRGSQRGASIRPDTIPYFWKTLPDPDNYCFFYS